LGFGLRASVALGICGGSAVTGEVAVAREDPGL
jgi:hypothetical protein